MLCAVFGLEKIPVHMARIGSETANLTDTHNISCHTGGEAMSIYLKFYIFASYQNF